MTKFADGTQLCRSQETFAHCTKAQQPARTMANEAQC